MRTIDPTCSRPRVHAAALTAALLLALPASAEAGALRIRSATVTTSTGVVPVALSNPSRSAARGRLTIRVGALTAGSKAFTIPARSRRTVRVQLAPGAVSALQELGSMSARATASATGMRAGRRSLTLVWGGAPPAGGEPGGPGPAPGPGPEPAPSPSPSPGPGPSPSQLGWRTGEYRGGYTDNGAKLSFEIEPERLVSQALDNHFYLTMICENQDPSYTGPNQRYETTHTIWPVEAPIGSDGTFSGQGLYKPSPDSDIHWTISGTVSGTRAEGEFSAQYVADSYGNPCSGTTKFWATYLGE